MLRIASIVAPAEGAPCGCGIWANTAHHTPQRGAPRQLREGASNGVPCHGLGGRPPALWGHQRWPGRAARCWTCCAPHNAVSGIAPACWRWAGTRPSCRRSLHHLGVPHSRTVRRRRHSTLPANTDGAALRLSRGNTTAPVPEPQPRGGDARPEGHRCIARSCLQQTCDIKWWDAAPTNTCIWPKAWCGGQSPTATAAGPGPPGLQRA